ncbi:hypothetical protein [Actinomadura sp. 6N118]|uniref:hypothetical protein n=1 Tax=Actinomadura sp. 6N118 TaxID=3375151 RepID=UPI003789A372
MIGVTRPPPDLATPYAPEPSYVVHERELCDHCRSGRTVQQAKDDEYLRLCGPCAARLGYIHLSHPLAQP